MVDTRFRPILFIGTHNSTHGEMFYGLFKPHHRVLQIDISQHCLTLARFGASERGKASETWANYLFERRQLLN